MDMLYFKSLNGTLIAENASSSGIEYIKIQQVNMYLTSVLSIFCDVFSTLAFCVLGYFIHKRYRIYQKIKRTTNREFPTTYDVKKKLKNMKIEALVYNVIIFIIIIEIFENVDMCIYTMNIWIKYFFKIPKEMGKLDGIFARMGIVSQSLNIILVPILCIFLRVLWLIYNHYPCKDALMKWWAYIIIRLSSYLINYFLSTTIPINTASTILCLCFQVAFLSFYVFEYVMYLKYARQFYLHLKSREEEIRLHYYDEPAYRHSRFVRKYFSHSITFVAISLFFLSFSYFIILFTFTVDTIDNLIPIIPLEAWNDMFGNIIHPISNCVYSISQTVYRLLSVLSYLYMIFVVVRELHFKRIDYININDRMKPLLQQYHDKF